MATKISEEDGTHKEWMVRAKEMTLADLPEFLRHLSEDYEHDYGTICHAIASAAVAAAWAMDRTPQGGITGSQAGAVTWEILRGWNSSMIGEMGSRIQNMDNLLYPQYARDFTSIKESTLERVREEAAKRLAGDCENVALCVLEHWKFIANGGVPFGLEVAP